VEIEANSIHDVVDQGFKAVSKNKVLRPIAPNALFEVKRDLRKAYLTSSNKRNTEEERIIPKSSAEDQDILSFHGVDRPANGDKVQSSKSNSWSMNPEKSKISPTTSHISFANEDLQPPNLSAHSTQRQAEAITQK
jgi:hypothetical protein